MSICSLVKGILVKFISPLFSVCVFPLCVFVFPVCFVSKSSFQIKCLTFHILDIMNIVEIILSNCCITDDIHMQPHTA